MNREDAIKVLNMVEAHGLADEAKKMAIEALEHEQQSEWERDHEILKAYADGQESMKPCWIPVSERLPEDGEDVLVYAERNAYVDSGKIRKKVIDIGWQVEGRWHIDGCNGVYGIAWMPLPEPYKAESEVSDADSD